MRPQSGTEVVATRPPRKTERWLFVAIVTASILLAFAICLAAATAKATAAKSKVGGTLTVAIPTAPSFNPQTRGPGDWATDLTYDSLIRVSPKDGSYVPGLAAKWGYIGRGNKHFRFTLRTGVRFSDGTQVTAVAVKKSIDAFVATKSYLAAGLTKVSVAGPLTVELTFSIPNPAVPELLSDKFGMGAIISPAGLAHADSLGSRTAGAGPYVLVPSQTVTGDHYTFVPNKYYWDKSAIHYKKIVERVISDNSALVNALRTGQVDVGWGDFTNAGAAEAAGLKVVSQPSNFFGIALADLNGTLVPQLKSLKVRQALNYAIDRKAIANALFKKWGGPASQISLPGYDGYDPSLANAYPYNPTKAKQLLAEAGYPNGFSLTVLSTPVQGFDTLAQAVASYWAKIGVTVKIQSDNGFGQFFTDMPSAKFPAYVLGFGALPFFVEGQILFIPSSFFNPFHYSDPVVSSLYYKALRVPKAQQVALYHQLSRRISSQAWYVIVASYNHVIIYRASIGGTSWAPAAYTSMARDFYPTS